MTRSNQYFQIDKEVLLSKHYNKAAKEIIKIPKNKSRYTL